MSSTSGVPDEAFALGSATLWAVASVLFTVEGRSVRPAVMNAAKSMAASLVFAVVLLISPIGPLGRPAGALFPATGVTAVLALSGVIGIALGDTCYFESLARVGVRRTMMLGLLAPLFTAGASAIAGQPLPGLLGYAGIAITLAGILLVVRVAPVREEAGGEHPARVPPVRAARARPGSVLSVWGFGVTSALCQAIGIVMTKDAIQRSSVLPASLLRLLAGGLGILAFELVRGRGIGLPREMIRGLRRPRLILATLLGTVVGFFLFQAAVMLGSPPITAALCATSPLLVAPIAAHWLRERMPRLAALGTILAVGGVILIVLD